MADERIGCGRSYKPRQSLSDLPRSYPFELAVSDTELAAMHSHIQSESRGGWSASKKSGGGWCVFRLHPERQPLQPRTWDIAVCRVIEMDERAVALAAVADIRLVVTHSHKSIDWRDAL